MLASYHSVFISLVLWQS